MTPGVAVALALAILFVVALGVLTAMGSRRRGADWAIALLSGMFFPAAWIAWYVQDE